MANECLVTKLKGVVQNDNLDKLDEVRFYQISSPAKRFDVGWPETFQKTVRAIGAVFSGGQTSFVSNAKSIAIAFDSDDGNAIIRVDHKDTLAKIDSLNGSFTLLGKDLKYLPELDFLNFRVRGDITDLIPSLERKLSIVLVGGSQMTGNIEAIEGYADKLLDFNIESTGVTGDATVLLRDMVNNTSGSVGFAGSHISMDLSLITHDKIQGFFVSETNEIRWTQTRSSTLPIIAMQEAYMGDYIDAMLINQADCQVGTDTSEFYRTISVHGTRTSASDAAVVTLKNKGYTVRVNGIVL